MKKVILNLVALLVSVNIALASSPKGIISIAESAVVVDFSDWKTEAVTVSIFDESGYVVFKDEVSTSINAKKYSLKRLPEGKYTIATSDAYRILEQHISFTNNQVKMIGEESITYKPIIAYNDLGWNVNFYTQGLPATVKIFDVTGTEVYSQAFNIPVINKRFNIASLANGQYTIAVQSSAVSNSSTVVK